MTRYTYTSRVLSVIDNFTGGHGDYSIIIIIILLLYSCEWIAAKLLGTLVLRLHWTPSAKFTTFASHAAGLFLIFFLFLYKPITYTLLKSRHDFLFTAYRYIYNITSIWRSYWSFLFATPHPAASQSSCCITSLIIAKQTIYTFFMFDFTFFFSFLNVGKGSVDKSTVTQDMLIHIQIYMAIQ